MTRSQLTAEERLARLDEIEKRMAARKDETLPWPEGLTADDLIREAREERFQEFIRSQNDGAGSF